MGPCSLSVLSIYSVLQLQIMGSTRKLLIAGLQGSSFDRQFGTKATFQLSSNPIVHHFLSSQTFFNFRRYNITLSYSSLPFRKSNNWPSQGAPAAAFRNGWVLSEKRLKNVTDAKNRNGVENALPKLPSNPLQAQLKYKDESTRYIKLYGNGAYDFGITLLRTRIWGCFIRVVALSFLFLHA